MEVWHIWIVAAIILLIAEIFTPGFVLACFGVACAASGLVSFLEVGVKGQVVTFSVATLVVFFGIRPFFLKHSYPKSQPKTNVDALVGKKGFVSEEINPEANQGRVIVEGEDWRGVSIDETVIEKGEKITVIKVEGAKLCVKRMSANQEE